MSDTAEESVYRARPCGTCAELRQEIQQLKDQLRGKRPVYPRQGPKSWGTQRCPFCRASLFEPVPDKAGYFQKLSQADLVLCQRRRWWHRCPRLPHFHRYCHWCQARWLEETAE